MCSLSFSPSYVQSFAEFLMDQICSEANSMVRKPLLQLAHSLLKQDGKCMNLTFQQWLGVVYYIEGAEIADLCGARDSLYSGKDCKEEMAELEEDIRAVVLAGMRGHPIRLFLQDMSQCFINALLGADINFVFVHHLMELVSSLCVGFEEHNRDIKPELPAILLGLYKPLKMLILRLLETRIRPESVFQQAWDIFVDYVAIVEDFLEESLLDVMVSLLNKYLLAHPSPNAPPASSYLPYLSVLSQTLPTFTGRSHLYPELCSSLLLGLFPLLPNAIYPHELYTIIEKVIVFRPEVLEDDAVVMELVHWLTEPYTEEDDRWRQFIEEVGKRVAKK